MDNVRRNAIDLSSLPMFQSRNRNWRDKLDFSITSSSVTVTVPSVPQLSPISANALMNSHPSAPAPTRNTAQEGQ